MKREGTLQGKTETTFSLTYYPVFKNVRKILEEIHLLLKPDQAHKKVFSGTPIIGFKNANSLKDHLVRAVLPQLDREGRSKHVMGQIVHVKYSSQLKRPQSLKRQSQRKLLTFLKVLWIVIATM